MAVIVFSNNCRGDFNPKTFPEMQPNATREGVTKFLAEVKLLTEHPDIIDSLSPQGIELVLGRVGGECPPNIRNSFSTAELDDLRDSQIMVIGLAIESLEKRVDLSVSQTSFVSSEMPLSYDLIADENYRNDRQKRKEYEDSVNAELNKSEHINEQVQLKEYLADILRHKRNSLRRLCGDDPKLRSEAVSILTKAGLDAQTINNLILKQ